MVNQCIEKADKNLVDKMARQALKNEVKEQMEVLQAIPCYGTDNPLHLTVSVSLGSPSSCRALVRTRGHDSPPRLPFAVPLWSLGCVMAELVDGGAPFQGIDYEDLLCEIFGVLGNCPRASKPSEEGFEVLSDLLTCNPDKRLTAAATIKHSWFSKIQPQEVPQKEEAVSPLPKRPRRHAVCAT
ncbi:mitogen-activated protein kinase spk1-like [Panicum virgatum]|uniref:mitogen-activated protein kinase spk1-like n=1 Tax=Panicum virgatum TaxID=38727 RepID=UPI0019D58E86|nr:mitogen-activated protein kinase spk1-like [Panicum virgatum]